MSNRRLRKRGECFEQKSESHPDSKPASQPALVQEGLLVQGNTVQVAPSMKLRGSFGRLANRRCASRIVAFDGSATLSIKY